MIINNEVPKYYFKALCSLIKPILEGESYDLIFNNILLVMYLPLERSSQLTELLSLN